MAVRGSWSKGIVKEKILETFKDSFENGSEIRIPLYENEERVEIKVTLTCAKTNVGDGAANETTQGVEAAVSAVSAPTEVLPPSEEEKAQVNNLLAKLGL